MFLNSLRVRTDTPMCVILTSVIVSTVFFTGAQGATCSNRSVTGQCCACQDGELSYYNADCRPPHEPGHYRKFMPDFTCTQHDITTTTTTTPTTDYSTNQNTTLFNTTTPSVVGTTSDGPNADNTTTAVRPTTPPPTQRWFVYAPCSGACAECDGPGEYSCTVCAAGYHNVSEKLATTTPGSQLTTGSVSTTTASPTTATQNTTDGAANGTSTSDVTSSTTSDVTTTYTTADSQSNSTTVITGVRVTAGSPAHVTTPRGTPPTHTVRYVCLSHTECPYYNKTDKSCHKSCPRNTYGVNGKCMKQCPDGLYKDELSGVRICSHCKDTFIENDTCVEKCPDDKVMYNGTCITLTKCEEEYGGYADEDNYCLLCTGMMIGESCVDKLVIILPCVGVLLLLSIIGGTLLFIKYRRRQPNNDNEPTEEPSIEQPKEGKRSIIPEYGNIPKYDRNRSLAVQFKHDEILRYTPDPVANVGRHGHETRSPSTSALIPTENENEDYGGAYLEMRPANQTVQLNLGNSPHGYVNENFRDDTIPSEDYGGDYGNVPPKEDFGGQYGNVPPTSGDYGGEYGNVPPSGGDYGGEYGNVPSSGGDYGGEYGNVPPTAVGDYGGEYGNVPPNTRESGGGGGYKNVQPPSEQDFGAEYGNVPPQREGNVTSPSAQSIKTKGVVMDTHDSDIYGNLDPKERQRAETSFRKKQKKKKNIAGNANDDHDIPSYKAPPPPPAPPVPGRGEEAEFGDIYENSDTKRVSERDVEDGYGDTYETPTTRENNRGGYRRGSQQGNRHNTDTHQDSEFGGVYENPVSRRDGGDNSRHFEEPQYQNTSMWKRQV